MEDEGRRKPNMEVLGLVVTLLTICKLVIEIGQLI